MAKMGGRGIPKDRTGMKLILPKFGKINCKIDIPNCINYKTIQLELSTWIKVNREINVNEVNKNINRATRNIKARIRDTAKQTKIFHENSIVIITTGDMESGRKDRERQFLTIECTLFNKNQKYDKHLVKSVVRTVVSPLVKEIIEYDLNDEIFDFVEKVRKKKYE